MGVRSRILQAIAWESRNDHDDNERCRYARCRAKGGDLRWASWALLPVYEYTLIFKKFALVLIIFAFALGDVREAPTCGSKATSPVSFAIAAFATQLYKWTYATVLYVLLSHSAGTTTMQRAVGIAMALTLIGSTVYWGEVGSPSMSNGHPVTISTYAGWRNSK